MKAEVFAVYIPLGHKVGFRLVCDIQWPEISGNTRAPIAAKGASFFMAEGVGVYLYSDQTGIVVTLYRSESQALVVCLRQVFHQWLGLEPCIQSLLHRWP